MISGDADVVHMPAAARGRHCCFLAALLALSACTQPSSGVPFAPAAVRDAPPMRQTMLAFAPGAPTQVLGYKVPSHGDISPVTAIAGGKTGLRKGLDNIGGTAFAPDGSIVVLDSGLSGAQLLGFKRGATGNAHPSWRAALPNVEPSFYSYAGFATDSRGLMWTTEIDDNTIVAFQRGSGSDVSKVYAIHAKLRTPGGLLPAPPTTVAIGGDDVIYATCAIAHSGATASGVTRYAIGKNGKPKLISSFYDFHLPERPVDLLAVDDARGVMYVASSGAGQAIFVYRTDADGTNVRPVRGIQGKHAQIDNIEALAVDRTGRLYVATPNGIMVFAPGAVGDARPIARLTDPTHLHYRAGETGSYLAIR